MSPISDSGQMPGKIFRATYCLVVLVIAVIADTPPALAATAMVTLSPGSVVVAPGQQTVIDVGISSDAPIRGVQLKLRFDPRVIRIDDVTQGNFLPDWAAQHGATAILVFPFTPDNTTGETKIGAIALFGGPAGPGEGVTGSGTLLHVTLTGVSSVGSTSTVLDMDSLVLADASGQRVQGVEAAGASVVVGPPAAAPAPAPTSVALSTPPKPVVEVLSPREQLVGWMRHNVLWLSIVGAGLIGAAAIYALVVRLGYAQPPVRRGEF